MKMLKIHFGDLWSWAWRKCLTSKKWACGQLGSLHQILKFQAEPPDTGEEQDHNHGWLCSSMAAQLHMHTHKAKARYPLEAKGQAVPSYLKTSGSRSLTWPWLPLPKAYSIQIAQAYIMTLNTPKLIRLENTSGRENVNCTLISIA